MDILRPYLKIILLIGITTWLAACGGGGGGGSTETVTISGRVATEANPGGEVGVTVKGFYSTDPSIPSTMTAADGTYTLTVKKDNSVSIQFSKPGFITLNTESTPTGTNQIDFDFDPYPTTAAVQMIIDTATGVPSIPIASKGWLVAEANDVMDNELNGISFLSTVPPEAEVYTLCDGTGSGLMATTGAPCPPPERDIMYGAYFDAAVLPVEIDVSVPGDMKTAPIRLGEITFLDFVL